MDNQVVDAVTLGQSVMAHDMSLWGLIMQAGLVVKIIMVGLMLASVWVWAIIIEKLIRLRKLRAQAAKFEEAFWSGGSLEDLYDRIADSPRDPMSAIFVSAMREWRRSNARGVRGDTMRARLQQRLEKSMEITLGREMDRVERYMTFLASVGSTAPFVGLFGTVWGIMASFQSIAATKNTSLAVVAPGIAEALFATAMGLIAAIPAVVAYNKISSDLNRYGNRLEAFVDEFSSILSRQLDDVRD